MRGFVAQSLEAHDDRIVVVAGRPRSRMPCHVDPQPGKATARARYKIAPTPRGDGQLPAGPTLAQSGWGVTRNLKARAPGRPARATVRRTRHSPARGR
jgi:hypothetical protein